MTGLKQKVTRIEKAMRLAGGAEHYLDIDAGTLSDLEADFVDRFPRFGSEIVIVTGEDGETVRSIMEKNPQPHLDGNPNAVMCVHLTWPDWLNADEIGLSE